ncbi:inositol monophosphatase family protein [Nocardiopsis potens]|uniref:inositol monophosphatase family protein n=1 Tax=Nocardiopsis potens TaxID=1246458 RepID=UPI0003492C30|nr:inositol monophosphatase family protein [Nocardiopsis potens]
MHGPDGPAGLLPLAREAVARARRIVRSRVPAAVTAKGDRDLVTDVDLAVEEEVRSFLARETPEIGLLGEEHGLSGAADGPRWVLDPIDGTANFARGIPLCAVSLGLLTGGRSVLAVIDHPFLGVVYTAVQGGGAHAGGEPIRVSAETDPARAAVAIGDFARGEGAAERNRVRLALMERLGGRVQRLRMFGAAAVDLAWTASGRIDAAVILANLPWDTSAGALLVREAGGLVLDADGSEHTADSAATIAVAPGLRGMVLDELGRARAAG